MTVDRFPVEASHIMMFARAIGDTNPVYFDADHAASSEVGGIIAPPTFVQASDQFDPDYFLRPQPGRPWLGSGREATGVDAASEQDADLSGRLLHAEQHFIYHRPPRAGDVLSVTVSSGRSWEKIGRRGGRLRFSEVVMEYRDQAGAPVVTSTAVGVNTEVAVEQ